MCNFDVKYVLYCVADFYMDDKNTVEPGLRVFLTKLKEEKIEVISFEGAEVILKGLSKYLEDRGQKAKKGICITSKEEWLCKALELDMAVVAFENSWICRENLWKAKYVVEDLSQIEPIDMNRFYQRHHHMPWKILETERCTVMEQTLDDIPYMKPLFEPVKEVECMKSYIENVYGFYGYGLWCVRHKEHGFILGRAGVTNREFDGEVQLELGYMIDEKYQRRGYAFEICNAILIYAKTVLDMSKINCLIQKENQKSILLAEKLGFQWKEEIVVEKKIWQRFYKDA